MKALSLMAGNKMSYKDFPFGFQNHQSNNFNQRNISEVFGLNCLIALTYQVDQGIAAVQIIAPVY